MRILILLLFALTASCHADPQYTKSVKSGYGSKGYQHNANMVSLFGNPNQNGTNAERPNSIGVCYKEVPTASLAKDPSNVPIGNGSRSDLSVIRTCCPGYIRNIHNFYLCDPVCTEECVNSLCTSPDTCTCFMDHVKNEAGFCVPTCPIGCQNGRCDGGECMCQTNYKLSRDGNYCVPICKNNCGGVGNCTAPDTCTCRSGYEATQDGSCRPRCSRGCPTVGVCTAPEICTYPNGLTMGPANKSHQNPVYFVSLNPNGTIVNSDSQIARPDNSTQHPYNNQESYPYTPNPYQPRIPNVPLTPFPHPTMNRTNETISYLHRRVYQNPQNPPPGFFFNPYGGYYQPIFPGYSSNYTGPQTNPNYPSNQPIYYQYPNQQLYPGQQGFNPNGPYYQPGYNQPFPPNQPGSRPHNFTNDLNNNHTTTSNQPQYQPGYPNYPNYPYQPGYPYPQGNPNPQGYIYNPAMPNQPGYPYQPGYNQPGQPGYPYGPGPNQQSLHGPSTQPGQPGYPGHGGQPGYHGHHDHSGYPSYSRQPSQPGLPGPPGQPGQAGQPGQPGQYSQPGQPGSSPYGQNNQQNTSQFDYYQQATNYEQLNKQVEYIEQPRYMNMTTYLKQSSSNTPPHCTVPCVNAECVEGNRCVCDDRYGYVALTDESRCKPICHGCLNGVCTAPNVCICNEGYHMFNGVKGRKMCVKRDRRSIKTEDEPVNIADMLVYELPDEYKK